MRILVIGNVGVGGGVPSWSTENDIAETLRLMGHVVDPMVEGDATISGQLVRERADLADLVLWISTPGRCRPEMAEALRGSPTPKLGMHLDLYRGLKREDVSSEAYMRTVDLMATADGGAPAGWWESRGINHVWSPPAVLETSCYLAEPDPVAYPHDVVFVGSRGYHKEWPWRPRLIDALARRYGSRFGLYEHGWRRPGSTGHGIDTKMRGANANVLYATAKVAVGDSCFAGDRGYDRYVSDRLFEAGGRGAAQVWPVIYGVTVDGWAPIEGGEGKCPALMREGDHVAALFDAGDERSLFEAVDVALSISDDDRRELRERSVAHVREHHTYRQRVEVCLAELRASGFEVPE